MNRKNWPSKTCLPHLLQSLQRPSNQFPCNPIAKLEAAHQKKSKKPEKAQIQPNPSIIFEVEKTHFKICFPSSHASATLSRHAISATHRTHNNILLLITFTSNLHSKKLTPFAGLFSLESVDIQPQQFLIITSPKSLRTHSKISDRIRLARN